MALSYIGKEIAHPKTDRNARTAINFIEST